MKSFKQMALAGGLALALVSGAQAQTEIKITGSTAFRAGAIASIINSLNSPVAAYADGTAINKATRAIIGGNLKSTGAPVFYELAWSGSVAGVSAVANGLVTLPGVSFDSSHTWLATTNTMSAVTATRAANQSYSYTGGTSGAATFEGPSKPDVAFSDSSVNTIKGSGLASGPAISGVAPSGISTNDGIVGVIPFVWVKGPAMTGLSGQQATDYANGYARLTNLTAQNVQSLWLNGIIPLSAITGNTTDQNVDVILVGRNNDSGTRLGSLAESFDVSAAIANPYSIFDLAASSGNGSAITNVAGPYDNGGYASGGSLASAVNLIPQSSAVATEPNGLPFILVTYLGVADALTVVNPNGSGHGALLTYNGVGAPIVNPTGGPGGTPVIDLFNPSTNLGNLITQGSYSFWEQEHVYFRPGLTSGTAGTLVQAVNDMFKEVYNTDAIAAGMRISDLASGSYYGSTSRVDELSTVLP